MRENTIQLSLKNEELHDVTRTTCCQNLEKFGFGMFITDN